jgi:hypothetical protein
MKRFICAVLLMLFAAVPSQSSETVLGVGGDEVAFFGASLYGGAIGSGLDPLADYSDQHCLRIHIQAASTMSYTIACSNLVSVIFPGRSIRLTRFSLTIREAFESADTGSCTFRLVGLDDNEFPNSELAVGPSAAAIVGTTYSTTFDHVMVAGDAVSSGLKIQVKDGTTCPAGAACDCDTTFPEYSLQVWGVWQ